MKGGTAINFFFLDYPRVSVDVFVVYLISDRKPIHEILNPRIKDIKKTYCDHFAGMPRTDVSIERLCEMQISLPGKILNALTERHRTFLIGFNEGEPDWNLLSFPNARILPAVRWKQTNLDKMDPEKRSETTRKLEQVFKDDLKR